jgi:pSer/pThr/pTyr-binding forkhead associated (FHA) protein
MLGELVPCAGGPPIPLRKPRLVLGRHRDCDVPLGFSTISGRHCELELRDGYWMVRDLGSSNGTRVNGTLCGSRYLMPKDVLALATHRYSIEYTPPPGRPPPREAASPAAAKAGPGQPAAAAPAMRPAPAGPPGGARLGELVPCGGGDPVPLTRPRILVGRHEACDVVIRSGSVSARHCELEWTEGSWFVRDLGSRNGIRVDGERCQAKILAPGSILAIANHRYRIVYGQPGAARAAVKGPVFAQSLLEAAGLTGWQPPPAAGKRKPGDEDEPPRPRYSLDDPV